MMTMLMVMKLVHLYTSSLIHPLGKAGHSNLRVVAPDSILTYQVGL